MINELKTLRQELHRNPELSGFESKTAKRIRSFIEIYHPTKIIENFGGYGLAAIYEFSSGGPTIAIRCELDALPIKEENQFNYKSIVKGVSHKCGHDGHMAMVAGLIFWINKLDFESGKIVLLFQSAEETGQGAYQMLEDARFSQLKIDYIFALHNIPGEPVQSIINIDSCFSAEVQSFALKVKGKESHAAEPENGINPALGISALISALSKLTNNDPEDENFTVITPVYINMGQKSYGISPATGELNYTIRTWSTGKMTTLKSEIEHVFMETCQKYELEYSDKWFEYFPASENDIECTNLVTKAARKNNLKIRQRTFPFKFGEDFGWFSRKYKTAMFGLGAGVDTPVLHSADYDFPDEIIETGINMFKSIISNILEEQKRT